jgi:hypothetical protein
MPPMTIRKNADRLSRRKWNGNCGNPIGSTATSGEPCSALRAMPSSARPPAPPTGNSTLATSVKRRKANTPATADQQPRGNDQQHPVQMYPKCRGVQPTGRHDRRHPLVVRIMPFRPPEKTRLQSRKTRLVKCLS